MEKYRELILEVIKRSLKDRIEDHKDDGLPWYTDFCITCEHLRFDGQCYCTESQVEGEARHYEGTFDFVVPLTCCFGGRSCGHRPGTGSSRWKLAGYLQEKAS